MAKRFSCDNPRPIKPYKIKPKIGKISKIINHAQEVATDLFRWNTT